MVQGECVQRRLLAAISATVNMALSGPLTNADTMRAIPPVGAAMSARPSEKVFVLREVFGGPLETRTPDPLITPPAPVKPMSKSAGWFLLPLFGHKRKDAQWTECC
jgi:hypothetical protein